VGSEARELAHDSLVAQTLLSRQLQGHNGTYSSQPRRQQQQYRYSQGLALLQGRPLGPQQLGRVHPGALRQKFEQEH